LTSIFSNLDKATDSLGREIEMNILILEKCEMKLIELKVRRSGGNHEDAARFIGLQESEKFSKTQKMQVKKQGAFPVI